jgi:uncharacterized membrane protein
MYASDFRRIARENLSGRWLISAAVCFIASLLGGLSSGGSVDISSEDLEVLGSLENVPWLLPLLNGVLIYALITAIVAFIIGGVIQLGLNTDDLKLFSAAFVALALYIPYYRSNHRAKTLHKGGKTNA